MSSVIVQPITANIMNAVMCGLMSFGLLMTPQKFMQGGAYQRPWFNNLPENRDNKLYYLGQFMAFIMLGGCVIPTLLNPYSQFLCYQMVLIHATNMIHSFIFLCSSVYKNARPITTTGKCQWYFMIVLSFAFFIVTLLACVHSTDNVIDSRETYIPKWIANTVMLAFSSVFGVLFILLPKLLLSFFWEDEQIPQQNEDNKKVMGFKLLNLTDLEKWWARCIGVAILCLNLGVAIDVNIHQPLFTAGSLVTVSTLTLFNFHQVVMRPYKSITSRHITLSWIPNILMSAVVIAILACGMLYVN
ncbi:hypothetical protein CPAV1605_964 [seawater metagenome]|uniref:Uncharacterized protein n=1 Tax=seawater metagenome TaxID=1561972 RepID=A0A5E8CKM1_9ZZZZ